MSRLIMAGRPASENRLENQVTLFPFWQLVASIVFISFGVVAAFCCAIVDGVFASRHIVSNPADVSFWFNPVNAVKSTGQHSQPLQKEKPHADPSSLSKFDPVFLPSTDAY